MLRNIFKASQKISYTTLNTRFLFVNQIKTSASFAPQSICQVPLKFFSEDKKPLKGIYYLLSPRKLTYGIGFEKFERRKNRPKPASAEPEEKLNKEEKEKQEIEIEEEGILKCQIF